MVEPFEWVGRRASIGGNSSHRVNSSSTIADDKTIETRADQVRARLARTAVAALVTIASHVGRLRHAQPPCEPGFATNNPAVRTAIEGLQIADTYFYYPEDRGISESARLAKEKALAIGTDYQPRREPVFETR
jgi:hypothetical protein